MPELLDTELTSLLRKNDATAFKRLYKQSFPVVAAYVLQNNGSDQDAEDIFQEAIVILVQNLKKPDFLLTAAPTTYLYSVARNQWLKRLRDNKPFAIAYEEDLHGDMLLETATSPPALAHQGLLHSLLMRITNHCRHLLIKIFLKNEPMERLMKHMGWKNKHTAANQKYKCLEQAKKVAAANTTLQ